MTAGEIIPIRQSSDIVRVRGEVRRLAVDLGLGIVDQTKIVTAASELARNTLNYGGGGEAMLEVVHGKGRQGLRLSFQDQGPGIPNIAMAMTDGYTSGRGLGLGLGGAKRLSNEFEITSVVGEGTRVVITRWK